MPRKTDIETLAPSSVEVIIGDRTYIQRPLSLHRTANLVVVLSEEIQKAATSRALEDLLSQDMDNIDAVAMLPMAIQVLANIPTALPRIVSIILTGADSEDEINFIDENCRLAQTMRILRTFIEQNEPEELIENFMVLRSTLSDAWSKAKVKLATPA